MPLIYTFLAVLLFILAVKVGLDRINDQRQKVLEGRRIENTLVAKEALLREVEVDISGFVDSASSAVPEKNPALVMLSQLKNLALVNGLTLTTFKVASETQAAGLGSVDVSFDIDGTLPATLSFLKSLSTIAPISTIEKVKVNTASQVASSNITIRVYFAEYPAKLPSLTEAVNNLTEEERKLLDMLSGLTQPVFTSLTPQPASGRVTPFN